jgi:hypothetical protein
MFNTIVLATDLSPAWDEIVALSDAPDSASVAVIRVG